MSSRTFSRFAALAAIWLAAPALLMLFALSASAQEVCDNGVDDDGDGLVDCDDTDCFADPSCLPATEDCGNGVDDDGDGDMDCDDADCSGDPACIGQPEVCDNGVDDDGDGLVDCDDPGCGAFPDCLEQVCDDGVDDDGDGFVDCSDTDCAADPWCLDADGDGYTPAYGDCDDTYAYIHPGALEFCNGLDNDCDGTVDHGLVTEVGCDDGLDDDCDGLFDCADDECSEAVECVDEDGDGFAVPDGDCDDHDPAVHPDAAEVCDGLDNDCDGLTDEEVTYAECFVDADQDGYGEPGGETVEACVCEDGLSANDEDCDDSDGDVFPGAEEACDGVDTDCDGEVDEGCVEDSGDDDDAAADDDTTESDFHAGDELGYGCAACDADEPEAGFALMLMLPFGVLILRRRP